MHAVYHYLRIMDRFADSHRMPVVITLEELAGVWNCSVRNVKLVVKQLSESGWITWQPGLGRGNRSKLSLLADLTTVVSSVLEGSKGTRGLGSAINLLGTLPPDSSLRTEVAELLGRHLVPIPQRRIGIDSRADSLLLPFYRELPNLDPLYATRRTEMHMALQLFDNLVRWDGGNEEFLPGLAIHWEMKADKWVFYLRKGVSFHDKKEFTSADALFTLRRLAPMAPWARIREAEAPEPAVLIVRTEAPSYILLHLLASPQAAIVPNDSLDGFARLPIGTGPFKLVRNDSEAFVMEAFEGYYRERAQLDSIEIWIMKELIANRMEEDRLAGHPILYEHPFQIQENKPEARRGSENVEGGSTVLFMNASEGKALGQTARRDALKRSIDPLKCVRELGGSRIGVSYSFFPDWTEELGERTAEMATIDEEDDRAYVPRVEWTKPLLLLTHEVLNHSLAKTAHWIRKECEASGISVEVVVVPEERAESFPMLFREADLLLFNAVTTTNCEADLLRLLFDEHGGLIRYAAPEVQTGVKRMSRKVAGEPDPTLRRCLLRDIEFMLQASASLVHLFHLKQTAFYHPKLLGTERYNPYGWIDFRELAIRPDIS